MFDLCWFDSADGKRLDGRRVRLSKDKKEVQLRKLRQRPHLIMDDIANGCESVLIPVFNEVDDTRPVEFTYIR